MDPLTILGIVGTGVNIVGKLMGGSSSSTIDKMQADSYAKKAATDSFNADIAHMGIDFAASKERTELGKVAEAGRSTLSAQRSYFAGGNLDPTFGSPLLVQAVTAGRVATDMDIVKANFAIDKGNALVKEASYRAQATSDMASSDMYNTKADADMTAGMFGAATSLLSGLSGLSKGGALGSMQVGSASYPAYGA